MKKYILILAAIIVPAIAFGQAGTKSLSTGTNNQILNRGTNGQDFWQDATNRAQMRLAVGVTGTGNVMIVGSSTFSGVFSGTMTIVSGTASIAGGANGLIIVPSGTSANIDALLRAKGSTGVVAIEANTKKFYITPAGWYFMYNNSDSMSIDDNGFIHTNGGATLGDEFSAAGGGFQVSANGDIENVGNVNFDNGAFGSDGTGNVTVNSITAAAQFTSDGGLIQSDTSGGLSVDILQASGDVRSGGGFVSGGVTLGNGIQAFGSLQTDNGGVQSDGSGNLTINSLTVSGNVIVSGNISSDSNAIASDGTGNLTANNFTNSDGLGLNPYIQPETPTTGATVTAQSSQMATVYITPAGTLATLTFNLPTAANSSNGMIVRVFTTQTITSLTTAVAGGGTIRGAALTTLLANTGAAWQRVSSASSGTWIRLY